MKLNHNGTVIKYNRKILVINNKPLNKEVCLENLTLLNDFCKNNNLDYFLTFGSLLGAIRENDFIEHDEDIDVGMFVDSYDKLFLHYDELKSMGFEIIRYDETGLVSIMRKGYYIDICSNIRRENYYSSCDMAFYPLEMIENTVDYDFLGITTRIPSMAKEMLKYEYGDNWMTPIVYKNSKSNIISQYIRAWTKRFIPKKLRAKITIRLRKSSVDMYMKRIKEYENESIDN